MLVFYLLVFTPILIQHTAVERIDYKVKNEFALTLFFVMLTALIMFRHESVGNDTRNYISIFRSYSLINWNELFDVSTEFGFVYYNKLISLVTDDPHVFFAITAVITMSMIYPTYRRLCLDASLTIVLFCTMSTFVMLFSGIRQMLAVSMGILAYESVRKRKMVCFIVTVLIAMTFHVSAFMLFAMYPVYHCKITKKWFYALLPVLGIVFRFSRQIFGLMMSVLIRFTRFDIASSDTGAYSMLIFFALLMIFSYWLPDESLLDEETKGLRNFLLLAVVIQMFAPLHTIAMRMNYYYIIFIPILIPKVLEARKDELRQVAIAVRWAMVFFFLAYFFVTLAPSKVLHVFPYKFFWEAGV